MKFIGQKMVASRIIFLSLATFLAVLLYTLSDVRVFEPATGTVRGSGTSSSKSPQSQWGPLLLPFPEELIGTVYNETDFSNDFGIQVPLWDTISNSPLLFDDDSTALKLDNPTNDEQKSSQSASWGPCWPTEQAIDWKDTMTSHPKQMYPRNKFPSKNNLDGMCRPGFLIIGAGKCGTSSLYHYLTSHPRVAPAKKKQIGYFTVSKVHEVLYRLRD